MIQEIKKEYLEQASDIFKEKEEIKVKMRTNKEN